MTTFDRLNRPDVPAILTPEEQRAVWFLGAFIRVRAGGSATGGFDGFTLTAGSPALSPFEEPPDEPPPDLAALAATTASYGIEILGPPPRPRLSNGGTR